MAARVQIIVEARDASSGVLRAITSQFGSLGTVIDDLTSKDFSKARLGQSLAMLAIDAGKKFYEMAKAGAQLQLVETRFNRLAEASGTTADVLLNDLRLATQGLYTDAQLMTSALDFMALGLAKNHEEAVRLSAVSAGLNMDMNQLVLTLTNMTTMRFDALGVRVDGFDAKVKKLEKTGLSAADAFKEAFLQQAEEQLTLVGHAADTSAGKVMKFEADIREFGDSMKISAINTLMFFENWEQGWRLGKPPVEELTQAVDDGKNSVGEFSRLVKDDLVQSLEEAKEKQEAYKEALKATDEENKQFLGVLESSIEPLGNYRDGLAEAKQQLAEGKINADEYKTKVGELADTFDEAKNRIILSIVEMKLAQGGWTDADIASYLKVGQQLGVFDAQMVGLAETSLVIAESLTKDAEDVGEAFWHSGQRAIDAGDKMDILYAKQAALGQGIRSNATPAASGLAQTLGSFPASGTMWDYYVNITTTRYTVNGGGSGAATGGNAPRQQGGTVYAGGGYRVGEAGSEYFMPAQNGRILGHSESLAALAQGGGMSPGGGGMTNNFYNAIVNISPDSESGSDIMSMR